MSDLTRVDIDENSIVRKMNSVNERIAQYKASLENRYDKENEKEQEKLQKKLLDYSKKLNSQIALEENVEKKKVLKELLEDYRKRNLDIIKEQGATLKEKMQAAGNVLKDTFSEGLGSAVSALSSAANTISKALNLDTLIDQIGKYQSAWDTRLYGSGLKYSTITKDITKAVGVSPYVQTNEVYQNLSTLIDAGIASNVEQRAFLMTISDEIATTFEVNNATLLQIVRVQQQDSTAARLGMEASLNSYLNALYQNTEYLKNVSDAVTTNLYEATSLLSSSDSIGFEYQVQKWLGSLYSVGMSSDAASSISSAIGNLASGNISALSGSGMQNLLIMAAQRAGLDYSSLLSGGLNADQTNQLMYGLVSYLGDLTSSTSSNIIKSQYASLFGLKVSDLQAISNLSSTLGSVSKSTLSSSQALGTLSSMANSIGSRMSVGEMMSNMWSNTQYNVASQIAANPALYAIYKVSGLLQDTMGGWDLGSISGTSLGNIADYMRIASIGGGIIGSIGSLISGGTSAGFDVGAAISQLGLNGQSAVVRGGIKTGISQSSSAYIGNSSVSDIGTNSILSGQSMNETVTPKSDDSEDVDSKIGSNVDGIYKLLQALVNGESTMTVKVSDYGLTNSWN